jgi:hypothetical protein
VKKHLASTGDLLQQYNNNSDFADYARCLTALAFVPPTQVPAYFEQFSQHPALPPALQPILDYFEQYYIGMRRANGRNYRNSLEELSRLIGTRRDPIFPIAMWSCHDRTLNAQDRTNNRAEAAHRALQAELHMDHPSIWKLIDALRQLQKKRDKNYEEMIGGIHPEVKRRKYREVDDRILRLVQEIEQKTPVEFLRGIAHNLSLK